MTNRIWLLRVKTELLEGEGRHGFSPWTDTHGFVIAAETAADARQMAAASLRGLPSCAWWLNADHSTCEEVILDGPRIIMADEPTG